MKLLTSKKHEHGSLSPDLAEALSRMDMAYEQASEGLPSLEGDWEFALLGMRSEIIEQVEEALAAESMTRADLARRMEVSRAYISKILNETANFQMETIAKLSVALNRDIAVRFIRKNESVVVKEMQARAESVARILEMFSEPETSAHNPYSDYRHESPAHHAQMPKAQIGEVEEGVA